MSQHYVAALVAAAQELGLELKEGQEALEMGETLSMIRSADSAGFKAMEKAGAHQDRIEQSRDLLSQLEAVLPVGKFFEGHRAAMGTHRGCRVLMVPNIRNESSSIIIVVMLQQPLSFNLHIYPETLGSKIGKFFLRVQDLQLGNAQLDPLVMVKAGDVAGATRKLTGTEVQKALLSVYQPGQGTPTCNDISVRASVDGDSTSQHLLDWTERLTGLALALRA